MDRMILYIYILALVLLMAVQTPAGSAEIPSSNRAKEAAKRVLPKLKAELRESGFKLGSPIFIRIIKESKTLEIFLEKGERFESFKSYPICYFSGELGPKLRVGDEQSPEGFYFVRPKQLNPYSRFHLSFNLGYPNTYDRAHGRTGSALMVHGNCVSIGCYAMTDALIEEIYTLVDAALRTGQPFFRVHIFPFEMTEANLKKHSDSPWISFWRNLKVGYDHFESKHRPPNVKVKNKMYIFEFS